MKKKILVIVSLLVLAVATSLTVYNYNCISLPGTPYHYMTLSEMPRDIQNNSLPIATAGSNFDNMPLSSGLNGQPNNNTDAGIALGRVLFYDKDLSLNHTISCADCHKQEFSFTDTAAHSYGWRGPLGPRTFRNAMNLNHIRFHKTVRMFWDLRASSIEDQVTQPMRDAVEMGMSLVPNGKQWDTIRGRITAKSFYPALFNSAFGSTTVDSQRIALALAQFVRSMNTFDSKFRRTLAACNCNAENATLTTFGFTAQEQLGRDLFMDVNRGNCQACHTRFIFVAQGAQNNGFDGSFGPGQKYVPTAWSAKNDYIGKDSGLAGYRALGNTIPYPQTNWQRDTGKIKANIGRMAVPTLINIGLTAPYFHDGRYKTLDQVINFYSDSIRNNDYNSLSAFFRSINPSVPGAPNNVQDQLAIDTAPVRRIAYTRTEKAALKAFLLTMTDSSILKDPKWSNPFCVTGVVNRQTSQQLLPVLALNAYPNNATIGSIVSVQLIAGQNFDGNFRIINGYGKVIYNQKRSFVTGSNEVRLDTKYLKPGVYIIQTEKNGSILSFKELIIS